MTKLQRLRKQADKLWFQKYLDECCEVCGSIFGLQGHHYFYKSTYGHLRYDKDNHITLDKKCHFKLHHRDPKSVESKIAEIRGKRWLNRLREKAFKRPIGSYISIGYYQDIITKLTK